MTKEINQEKLEKEIFEKLKVPFELSAYSVDSSRGFDLASLKAQYIPDRLNEVLGLTNWEFTGNFENVVDGEKTTGVLYHGILTIQIGDKVKSVRSVGYSAKKKNEGDSRKGAMTDALSKAASHVGVADEAFKGLVNPADIKKSNKTGKSSSGFGSKKPSTTNASSKKETPSFGGKKSQTNNKTEGNGW